MPSKLATQGYPLGGSRATASCDPGQLFAPCLICLNGQLVPLILCRECNLDSCNEHVGQGGGEPHLHGDPFGSWCLYSASDYATLASHPPLVSIFNALLSQSFLVILLWRSEDVLLFCCCQTVLTPHAPSICRSDGPLTAPPYMEDTSLCLPLATALPLTTAEATPTTPTATTTTPK